jgi:hypothetical protein
MEFAGRSSLAPVFESVDFDSNRRLGARGSLAGFVAVSCPETQPPPKKDGLNDSSHAIPQVVGRIRCARFIGAFGSPIDGELERIADDGRYPAFPPSPAAE